MHAHNIHDPWNPGYPHCGAVKIFPFSRSKNTEPAMMPYYGSVFSACELNIYKRVRPPRCFHSMSISREKQVIISVTAGPTHPRELLDVTTRTQYQLHVITCRVPMARNCTLVLTSSERSRNIDHQGSPGRVVAVKILLVTVVRSVQIPQENLQTRSPGGHRSGT